MVKKATRLKTSSAKTNLNVKKEEKKKMLFIPKMKERAKASEIAHPGVINDVHRYTVTKRARIININDIAIPDSIDNIFDIFPTLGIAKIEFFEKMKIQRIVDIEEKLNFENEAQNFDEEVRGDFEDTFGNEEMKERMRRQEEIEMNEQAQPMQDDRMAPPQRFRKHPLSGSDFF